MRLVALLLLLLAFKHYGYEPAAALYQEREHAARALFYVFTGLTGIAVLAVVLGLGWDRVTKRWRIPLLGVCGWWAIEEGQTAVCRVAHGIGEVPGYVPFEGLCGKGWYAIGLFLVTLLAAYVLLKHYE